MTNVKTHHKNYGYILWLELNEEKKTMNRKKTYADEIKHFFFFHVQKKHSSFSLCVQFIYSINLLYTFICNSNV